MARKRVEIIELDAQRLEELTRRAEEQSFDDEDYCTIRLLVQSYGCLTSMLGDKNTTIARLRKLLFGAATEKTDAIVGQQHAPAEEVAVVDAVAQDAAASESKSPRKKGHGRNGADAYAGAEKINVPHESLKLGDACPDCLEGTIYGSAPGVLVRIVGQAPRGGQAVPAREVPLQPVRQGVYGVIARRSGPGKIRRHVRQHDRSVEIRRRAAVQPC